MLDEILQLPVEFPYDSVYFKAGFVVVFEGLLLSFPYDSVYFKAEVFSPR